jgi:hypothetical protein
MNEVVCITSNANEYLSSPTRRYKRHNTESLHSSESLRDTMRLHSSRNRALFKTEWDDSFPRASRQLSGRSSDSQTTSQSEGGGPRRNRRRSASSSGRSSRGGGGSGGGSGSGRSSRGEGSGRTSRGNSSSISAYSRSYGSIQDSSSARASGRPEASSSDSGSGSGSGASQFKRSGLPTPDETIYLKVSKCMHDF